MGDGGWHLQLLDRECPGCKNFAGIQGEPEQVFRT